MAINLKDITANISVAGLEQMLAVVRDAERITQAAEMFAGQEGEAILEGASHIGLAMPYGRTFAIEPIFAMAMGNFLTETTLSELEDLRIKAETRRRSGGGGSQQSHSFRVEDGNARIEVIGAMTKRPHCLAELFGGSASTLMTQEQLYEAVDDPKIKDIRLHIESPGGDVAGAFDLADTIWEIQKKKPIFAYLSDQATSAGYLIAAQCTRIFGNANVMSGSMGVYTTLVDTSGRAAMQGAKVHLVKAGKYKGIGVPGVPISTDDIKTVQARIDAFHNLFIRYVKRGRGMSDEELAKVSDAQVFIGAEGVKVGLIDEIVAENAALEMARSGKGRTKNNRKVLKMSDTQNIEGAEQILTAEEVAALNARVTVGTEDTTVAAATTTPPTVPVIHATVLAQAFGTVATALGLTGSQATEAGIREMIQLGTEHNANVRNTAKKMSVIAGYAGDMNAHIDSLPFSAVLSHLKAAEEVARGKGLLDAARQTLPVTNANEIQVPPASANNGGEVRTVNDQVRDARVELQRTGNYSL